MDLAGLEIEVVVVRFPLIGLALGFLAPSGVKAKARSNLATELPFLGLSFCQLGSAAEIQGATILLDN